MVTLAILWIVTREVFGRIHPGVGDTLPLPLTALFALPAIRQFLPGNPPVGGTLDSFGVIPQILVLGSCVSDNVALASYTSNTKILLDVCLTGSANSSRIPTTQVLACLSWTLMPTFVVDYFKIA